MKKLCLFHSYEKQEIVQEKIIREYCKVNNGNIEPHFEIIIKNVLFKICKNCNKLLKETLSENMISCSQEQYLKIEELEKESVAKYRQLIVPKQQAKPRKKKDETDIEPQ
jgi:hypothetical protein